MAVKLLRKYIVFKTLVKLLLHIIIHIQFTFIYLLKENFEAQIAAVGSASCWWRHCYSRRRRMRAHLRTAASIPPPPLHSDITIWQCNGRLLLWSLFMILNVCFVVVKTLVVNILITSMIYLTTFLKTPLTSLNDRMLLTALALLSHEYRELMS